MSQHVVVVNDCAAPSVVGGPLSIRTRETPVGTRNFVLKFDDLAKGLPNQLTDRQLDWLETAGHLYAIDLACSRQGGDLSWAREIQAWLPVRDPEYWTQHASSIEKIFTAFTMDHIRISFVKDDDPNQPPRQDRKAFPDHDCVSLLSGGMDSFVGTAQLVRGGEKPLTLSHIAGGAISHAQDYVEAAIRESYSELVRVSISAKKYGSSFPNPEPSQRSRTFLFLAAACTVAAAGGSGRVFINENGIMAIHVPMTAARIGSLSTHTAAPFILENLEALATTVLETPVQIQNNLLKMTKPDVVELADAEGYAPHIQGTVSCWTISRTSHHCGICAPCLMRRISCEIHGVPDVTYESDAFEDVSVLERDVACDNLTHLLRLLDDLASRSDIALQIDFPELLNGGLAMRLAETLILHRRWAEQARGVLLGHTVPPMVRL